jgi:Family of unknown function (DUF6056)
MSASTSRLFNFSTWLLAIGTSFALGIYAYLGLFSRHIADDYCSVTFTKGNFFAALWENYLTISNRYTKFMLIALTEVISPRSLAILPGFVLVLWVIGIVWLLYEASRAAAQNWPVSVIVSLSFILAFTSLLEAPNLYQTLYWRSSSATHFTPLALMPYLAVFLIRSMVTASKSHAIWLYPLGFLLSFFLGGFSEPTLTVMIALLGLAIVLMWIYSKSAARGTNLALLIWTLAGAVTAILVMFFAPANSIRLHTAPPGVVVVFERSFLYGFEFALNSLKSLVLPSFFALITPLVIFFALNVPPAPPYDKGQQKNIWWGLMLLPFLSYLLIVTSFAPSVYGQGFPLERARFAGQVFLVAGLMMEGAALGILLAQWRPQAFANFPLVSICAILLIVAVFYPLRSGRLTLAANVPSYSKRAKAWDEREATIFSQREQGQTDLVIRQLDGLSGIKELDDKPETWVNRCAAEYYGVNSIKAVTIK